MSVDQREAADRRAVELKLRSGADRTQMSLKRIQKKLRLACEQTARPQLRPEEALLTKMVQEAMAQVQASAHMPQGFCCQSPAGP